MLHGRVSALSKLQHECRSSNRAASGGSEADLRGCRLDSQRDASVEGWDAHDWSGVDRQTNMSLALPALSAAPSQHDSTSFKLNEEWVWMILCFIISGACAFDDLSSSKVELRAGQAALAAWLHTNNQLVVAAFWHTPVDHTDQCRQEGMTRLSLSTASDRGEYFKGWFSFTTVREVIEEIACVTKSIRPQMNVDGLRIVVQQLGACHFHKIPNSVFSNARLMMDTNTTERYGLLGLLKNSWQLKTPL